MEKEKVNIIELFKLAKQNKGYLNVSAPMVRYSKLEFRKLLRKYGVELCFTPMIVAKSFYESAEARKVEFTTDLDDKPLIAQLAASNSYDLCMASSLLFPYVDGIDINCGCPQKWAINSGYGCALLKEPQIIYDMIKTIKRIQPTNEFSCSLKMRLLQQNNSKYTIDLCRKFESCGITFITVHGRTQWQKISENVNINSLIDIKKSLNIPLICNGDIRKLNDVKLMYNKILCDGIMSARGLLTNPTLFMGNDITTVNCIQDWLNLTKLYEKKITFQCLHHHLTFMMEKYLKRKQRVIFNNFNKKQQIYDFLYENYNLLPNLNDIQYNNINDNLFRIDFYNNDYVNNYNDNLLYIQELQRIINDKGGGVGGRRRAEEIINEWNENSNNGGKFYNNYKVDTLNVDDDDDNDNDNDSLNFMGTTIFDI